MKKYQILAASNEGFMSPVATADCARKRGVDPAHAVYLSDSEPLIFETEEEAIATASVLPKIRLCQFTAPNERGSVMGLEIEASWAASGKANQWYNTSEVKAYYIVPCIVNSYLNS